MRGESRGCGNIIGAAGVAARAAGVDGVFGRRYLGHLGAHDAGGACDLIDAFAAHPKGHEKCRHLDGTP